MTGEDFAWRLRSFSHASASTTAYRNVTGQLRLTQEVWPRSSSLAANVKIRLRLLVKYYTEYSLMDLASLSSVGGMLGKLGALLQSNPCALLLNKRSLLSPQIWCDQNWGNTWAEWNNNKNIPNPEDRAKKNRLCEGVSAVLNWCGTTRRHQIKLLQHMRGANVMFCKGASTGRLIMWHNSAQQTSLQNSHVQVIYWNEIHAICKISV